MPRKLTKVGKYDIEDLIAKGGMGAVYRAKHPTLKRKVILKQLTLRGGGGFIERFKREASLMIDMRDERIVTVYDHFREGSSYYIVMEYVEGTSLDRLLAERGRLSNEAALLIISEVAKGLKHAHDRGVIHRDIKPGNILISSKGEVKLTDFGIATSKDAVEDGLTKAGMTLGTPSYMSPEQISEAKKVDKRADIYSLGVMFYEMLTEKKPFPSNLTADTVSRINKGVYMKPRRLNPSIPRRLGKIIKKAMHHKVGKRYQDLRQVLDRLKRYTAGYRNDRQIKAAIKRYIEGEEIGIPRKSGVSKGVRSRRGATWLGLGAAAAVVLACGALVLYYSGAFFELFMSREYGRLRVTVSVPEEYYKDPSLIYGSLKVIPVSEQEAPTAGPDVRTYGLATRENLFPVPYKLTGFFSRIGGSGEDDAGNAGSENAGARDGDGEGAVLVTRPLYLPSGSYNLETSVQGRKLYSSVVLQPRSVQKQSLRTYPGKTFTLDLDRPSPRPVEFEHVVVDSITGRPLYNKAQIETYLRGIGWVDWKEYLRNPALERRLQPLIVSGKDYSFRYRADHYRLHKIDFHVERELDRVKLEVGLVPIPGTLIVESGQEGLRILINNQKQGYVGEENGGYIEYGETVEGRKTFSLPEGEYVLTIKKGRMVGNQRFSVRSEGSTLVSVDYDRDEKDIRISEVQR
jgi:serine/threonine-protein kinase